MGIADDRLDAGCVLVNRECRGWSVRMRHREALEVLGCNGHMTLEDIKFNYAASIIRIGIRLGLR